MKLKEVKHKRLSLKEDRIPVNEMTSKDFHSDINARIDVAAQPLKDRKLMGFFREVILNNKHIFHDSVVLNIGAGLGILSLFAAKAGAKRVYAIDNSNVIDYTKRIVKDNGYANKIKVIKCRVQDLILNGEVDVIISDWVGQSLFFQCLYDDIIYARDKWLKKGTGVIIPDVANLTIAAVDCCHIRNEHIEWWTNVYSFDMSSLREIAITEPIHRNVLSSSILSTSYVIKSINLNTATYNNFGFRSKLVLKMLRPGTVGGFMTNFSVSFSKSHVPMTYHIDPHQKMSHWMHTVFFFDKPLVVNLDELFLGGIEIMPAGKPLHGKRFNNLNINFELLRGDPGHMDVEVEISFAMQSINVVDNDEVT